MTIRLLSLLLASFVVLTGGAALACSPIEPMDMAPLPWQATTITPDMAVYIMESGSWMRPSAVLDPAGNEVLWDEQPAVFNDQILTLRPQGGWQLGDYQNVDSASTIYTVVEGEDVDEPNLDITWTGTSRYPFPMPCVGFGYDGVDVSVLSDEVGLYSEFFIDTDFDGEASAFTLDPWHHFETIPGERFDLGVRSIDLAGNVSEVMVGEVIGCRGCGSSMQGPRNAGPAISLVLVMVLIGRRRKP